MENNTRAYHFCNYYLSDIQQGIQAAHAQSELFLKYCSNNSKVSEELSNTVWEWAKHPTTICLNGGNHDNMMSTLELFTEHSRFPFAYFVEDEKSLDNLLTNVVILLPEYIYNAYNELSNDFKNELRQDSFSIFDIWFDHHHFIDEYCQRHCIDSFTYDDVFIIEHLSKHRLA